MLGRLKDAATAFGVEFDHMGNVREKGSLRKITNKTDLLHEAII